MAPTLLYTICALGAAALYLVLRPQSRPLTVLGAVLGLAAFAWLLVETVRHFAPGDRPELYYTIFSVIALASGLRMITHTRPVYCALYFVMIVLSSAGLFLLLAAEFMAFALIIVYAGAILVTYMFVLMLAQQAETGDAAAQPEYDRLPREPGFAAVVGFIMLALFSTMIFQGVEQLPQPTAAQVTITDVADLNRMPREVEQLVAVHVDANAVPVFVDGKAVMLVQDEVLVRVLHAGEEEARMVPLPVGISPVNIQQVGLALVAKFPVSLELAGIILLLAMFGAAVLSRRQIELSEDELRAAAGLRTLSGEHEHEDEAAGHGGGAKSSGGDAS